VESKDNPGSFLAVLCITLSVIFVIVSFADRGTEDIFDGKKTKRATRSCPAGLWTVARRKLDAINQAELLGDLRVPPGSRLETLKGDRIRQHSIRINIQYRVCFAWTSNGPDMVEIVDYH